MTFSRSQEDVFKYLISLSFLINHKEQAMNYRSSWYRSVLAGIALIAGLGLFATPALAQFLANGTVTPGGISANTDINNQATLNYAIAGTGQPAINSNTTTFKVDNKLNVQVTTLETSFVAVAPNATGQVTRFTVQNTGNAIMDYQLTPNGALANGQSVTLSGTPYADSNITAGFDGTGCIARVESGATAGFQALQDTGTAIVQLSPLSAAVTVYVVCSIPSAATATNLNNAVVSLTAITSNFNSCATACVNTTQAPTDTAGVDFVFADAAGSDDAVTDGRHSARAVYQVAAAVITVTKSVSLICDPLNGNTTPKNIPGAYVQYEITIANAPGAAPATLTTIGDTLSTFTTFDSSLRTGAGGVAPDRCVSSPAASAVGSGFRLLCTGTTRAAGAGRCANAGGQFFTTAADTDAMNFSAGAVNVTFGAVAGAQALPLEGTVTVGPPCTSAGAGNYCAGELRGGESVVIRFNAIIN